jgi:hypothetical protein
MLVFLCCNLQHEQIKPETLIQLQYLILRKPKVVSQEMPNIFHKNREISILTIKKKTARLTLPQEATERTKQGETKNKTKNEKHTAV